jgi:hypothetical protein
MALFSVVNASRLSTMTSAQCYCGLKAILFDMDGTLTAPYVNWSDLRVELGIKDGVALGCGHFDINFD